ncbi:MAG: winged helix-turn-helix transcriptional regulator [Mucilaginibacter sp.]|nr:winged helix-turn-helix transcriptional regulator [Mucilaginibacter sp.]
MQPNGFLYICNQKVSHYMRRDTFQAIADPTRRDILNRLAHQSLNVNSVAENFDVSRAAIYKHLKILTECGLVVIKQRGRERYCEAKLEKLSEVSDWVEQYRKVWTQKLDNLEDYLKELQAKNIQHGKQK